MPGDYSCPAAKKCYVINKMMALKRLPVAFAA
jgi:hypothetical protein